MLIRGTHTDPFDATVLSFQFLKLEMSVCARVLTIVVLLLVQFILKLLITVLHKYSAHLSTSELQFRFKRKSSTNLCTFVLKESLAYYSINDSTVFCSCWGPSCRLPTASPGRWIGGRPPDMVASCNLSG